MNAAQRSGLKSQLSKRLFPLYVAAFFQGTSFFFPIEKLFMTEIGFTAATIGLMAAFYAALVPLIEAPSGILADRWSRKYVLMIASIALMLMALVGGFSQNVPTYFLANIFLSVFLAMYSGTYDALVYDTVLEETGKSDEFEKQVGRIRFIFGISIMLTSVAGGVLASIFDLRFTYFAGIPLIALSLVALVKFKEPQLHKSQEVIPIKEQIRQTYKVLLQRGKLLPIVTIMVAAALLMNIMLEFSQLWLIALGVAVALYGPVGAGLLAADGFGGLLANRVRLEKRTIVASVVLLLIGSSLALVLVKHAAIIVVAQIIVAGIVAVITIIGTKLLHDQVPSNLRTGVASGVGAFTWMIFMPFSILFGWWVERSNIFDAAWMILPLAVAASVLLIKLSKDQQIVPAAAEVLKLAELPNSTRTPLPPAPSK